MAAEIIETAEEKPKRKPRRIAEKKRVSDEIITDEIAAEIANARDHYMGIHVMPSKDKWRVRKSGSIRAYGIYADKREAIKAARSKIKNFPVAYVFVHDYTGRVLQIFDK